MGDHGMQCSDHPYRNNPGGGVCALCLEDKLRKLLSSSFPLPIHASSSSSPSPSSLSPYFRSDDHIGVFRGVAGNYASGCTSGASLSSSLAAPVRPSTLTKARNDGGGGGKDGHFLQNHQYYCSRRATIPFLLAKKKKKIMVTSSSDRDIVFKRSKSIAAAGRNHRFLPDNEVEDLISPRKRGGFWSFLHFSSSSKSTIGTATGKRTETPTVTTLITTNGSSVKPREKYMGPSLPKKENSINNISVVMEDDEDSPNSQATPSASTASFERKVSRSRSVGCGSRRFSGDFFERISTGFGDCTLRRVESQREGKPKFPHMQERVKCGGIFGGFNITPSSSSTSSSSSYWVSSSAETNNINGKSSTTYEVAAGPLAHSRSRNWSWAFSSPMRAFSKHSSKDGKNIIRDVSSNNSTAPNLAAIPSLLAVRV